jgi:hypothetical protein
VLGVLALTALVGCSAGSGSGANPSPTTQTTGSPSPTPPGVVFSTLAANATRTNFSGLYRLVSSDPKRADGSVQVFRKGSSYRIDVNIGGTSSRLITTSAGLVSCQVTMKTRTCLLVAPKGTTLPRLFDPGLQRVFTTSLVTAATSNALTVTSAGVLPATATLAAAQCFKVAGPGIDPGEYCLTDTGLVRRAQFPSGTITMRLATATPPATVFVPPVRATPLP